ncbi:hypothetical protein V2J09_001551 [Rumex salicifolius]
MGRPPKKLMQQGGEENKILKPIDNEKAVSCCSTHLKIGTWSKAARHDQAIVIKIYFKKDFMAWDILGDNGVKNRIETKFGNIVAFKINYMNSSEEATFQVQATPEIKIDEAKEARRHPKWKDCEDFTNGQASFTRLHTFTCDSVKLKKFYGKILAARSVLTSLFNRPISLDEDPNPSQAPSGYPPKQDLYQSVPVQFPSGHVTNNFVGMETDPNPSQAPSGYPLNQNRSSYVGPHQFPASSSNSQFTTVQAHTQPWRAAQAMFPNGHVSNKFVGPANYPKIPALRIQPRLRIPPPLPPATLPVGHVANNSVGPHQLPNYSNVSIGRDRVALPPTTFETQEHDVCDEYLNLDDLPSLFSDSEKLKIGNGALVSIGYGLFKGVYDYDGMIPPPPLSPPQYPCQNGAAPTFVENTSPPPRKGDFEW